jgi:hypothetical protein
MFIRYRHSQLDNLEHIDITSHGLIMIIRPRLETSYWTCDYSWEFCILPISIQGTMDAWFHAPWRHRGIAQWPFLTMRILILGRLPIPCCQLHSCLLEPIAYLVYIMCAFGITLLYHSHDV